MASRRSFRARLLGDSVEIVPSLYVVALGLVVVRARVFFNEVSRAEELAVRRHAHSVDHAELKIEEHLTGTYMSPEAS